MVGPGARAQQWKLAMSGFTEVVNSIAKLNGRSMNKNIYIIY